MLKILVYTVLILRGIISYGIMFFIFPKETKTGLKEFIRLGMERFEEKLRNKKEMKNR